MLENQEYYNMFLTEDVMNESKMSAEERKKLHPETFGAKYDGEEKYPLNDEEHVRSAISYFHKAPEDKRKSLAKKIVKAAKKFGIEISEKSKVMKALKENVDKISDYYNEGQYVIINDFDFIKELSTHKGSTVWNFGKKIGDTGFFIVAQASNSPTLIAKNEFLENLNE